LEEGGFAIFSTPSRNFTAICLDAGGQRSVSRGNATIAQAAFQRDEFNLVNG
jgi:hypothetical protein